MKLRVSNMAMSSLQHGAYPAYPSSIVLNLPVELHNGSLGTTLGRCDRTQLQWKTGPWDTEPDVITWSCEGIHVVMSRDETGRWQSAFLSAAQSSERLPNRMPIPEIAALAGVEQSRIITTGILQLDELGLVEYFEERRGVTSRHWLPPLIVQGDKNGGAPFKGEARYIPAQVEVARAGRVLKALLLDERLHSGTNFAWAFDHAQRDHTTERFSRIDMRHVIAQFDNPMARCALMQTWGGELIVYADTETRNQLLPVVDLDLFLKDVEQLSGQDFIVQTREWLALHNMVKAASVEEIDATLARELALLDVVLA